MHLMLFRATVCSGLMRRKVMQSVSLRLATLFSSKTCVTKRDYSKLSGLPR